MQKTRTYTVRRVLEDTPCISITGKWLREFGIELGSKIRLVQDGEQLILMKIPDEEWEREQQEKKLVKMKKEVQQLEKVLQTS